MRIVASLIFSWMIAFLILTDKVEAAASILVANCVAILAFEMRDIKEILKRRERDH